MNIVVKALQSLKSNIYKRYQRRKMSLQGYGAQLEDEGLSSDLIYQKAYREGYLAGVDDSMETFLSSVAEPVPEGEGELFMDAMLVH